MRTVFTSRLRWTKNQRVGIVFLLAFIVGIEIVDFILEKSISQQEPLVVDWTVLSSPNETPKTNKLVASGSIQGPLRVNFMNKEDWQSIGFSQKQSEVILKYKYSLGGNFKNKKQLQDCFVIGSDEFLMMEPHLDFTINKKEKQPQSIYYTPSTKAEPNKTLSPFDPNELTKAEWQQLGFSAKQAQVILNYKNSLGGHFSTKQEIQKCFVIEEFMFQKLEPYIQLSPQKTIEKQTAEQSPKITSININQADFNSINSILNNPKVSRTLINFRKALGGFARVEQLKEVYGMSDSDYQKLKSAVKTPLDSYQTINLKTCDLRDLQKHPYLRKHAQKLMAWKQNKPSPEELDNLCAEAEINQSECEKILLYLVYK